MTKSGLAFALGVGLLIFSTGPAALAIENSCINCHKALPGNTIFGAKYQSWKTSIHAEEAVTCDRCHGGKPSAEKKEAAHAGVYNSSNPISRVYYKKVPGTCGACHRRDLNAFKRSAHYAYLEQTGAGPTCVTCHESHATIIISPERIPAVCQQCHNERMGINPQVPRQAQAVLLLINETSLLVKWARERVSGSDQKKLDEWKEAYGMMETVRDQWHAFNLKQVQVQILKIYDIIKNFWPKPGPK